MKKIVYGILTVILIVLVALFFIKTNGSNNNDNVLIENQITKETSEISIVTFGNRLEDKRAYFLQWEGLQNEESKKKALTNYKTFIFSAIEFSNPENQELIKDLIHHKKTVAVYGYQFDAKKTISLFSDLIPYYKIDATKPISTYLYGIGYSTAKREMIPIMVLGNMTEESMDKHIIDYLIKFNKENVAK